ncbi:MAG: UvrD-helicase domain-containing protein [Desulfuromonadales bacterium]|nr:UvrD-helicase domain-containing protein [Desulfuromonadales bacterium]
MACDPGIVPVDSAARRQALTVDGSFIVQAPAGSGKTELLIQRILALLAVVAAPEEILAITFTRKAAAEMRKRLLDALERAQSETPPAEAHAVETWQRARQALARDRERGWGLLEHPARLQVLTIDGLCAALVRRMPYLSCFGEMPAIAEDADELYRDAAERLCARLEGSGPESAALQLLLGHLDNRLPLLRDLLVAMLGRRDQWLRHVQPGGTTTARAALEGVLADYVCQALDDAAAALGPARLTELLHIGRWAAANLEDAAGADNPLAPLLDRSTPPGTGADDLPAWLAITSLLLTGDGQLRSPRGLNIKLGFPPGNGSPEAEMKRHMAAQLDDLGADPACAERLQTLRKLPEFAYTDPQWAVLAALIELLPLAVVELRTTFRQHGRIDFVEIARGALAALGDELAPTELLLQLDGRLRHILVDEFQDTSRAQYDLLATLTAGWERGDGRTLFLVGDPMQSIYRFREAEVGLYLRARAHGIGDISLAPLALSANFRSQMGLVDWCNRLFQGLFPVAEDLVRGAVPFVPAEATRPSLTSPAVTATCFTPRDDRAEAARVVELIRQARQDQPGGTIAVLVRARTHLAAIVPALKAAGLHFQAQEIDPLSDRPAIQDLLALTRALLHPADRVAWLAVLRAPWCGLSLDDLLMLVADRPESTLLECLAEAHAPQGLFAGLSAEGLRRLERVTPLLAGAVNRKGRLPLRRLVESTWLALGGPAGLSSSDLTDVDQFLALLDELDDGGDLLCLETLAERLAGLFAAPDAEAGPELQLMTIHKAKGLEFDTVILPGLGRTVGKSDPSLLLWQEDPDHGLLLAPIPPSGSDQPEPTYQALAGIHRDKDNLETLRLFYVAATRAKRTLHVLGHTSMDKAGELATPAAGSLLNAVWKTLAGELSLSVLAVAKEQVEVSAHPGIRRLPAVWVQPSLAASLPVILPGGRRASGSGYHEPRRLDLSLRTEEGRIIGTAVHGRLERMAQDGLEYWPVERLVTERSFLYEEMMGGGVPRTRIDACLTQALTALERTLSSPRGRWILGPHGDAACELAMTGVIDGVPVHAVIDRTFVDGEGVCWVIDYKTSVPGKEEAFSEFLEREREQYRSQLDDYRKLMALRKPQGEVRAALYFPLVDVWCEID